GSILFLSYACGQSNGCKCGKDLVSIRRVRVQWEKRPNTQRSKLNVQRPSKGDGPGVPSLNSPWEESVRLADRTDMVAALGACPERSRMGPSHISFVRGECAPICAKARARIFFIERWALDVERWKLNDLDFRYAREIRHKPQLEGGMWDGPQRP